MSAYDANYKVINSTIIIVMSYILHKCVHVCVFYVYIWCVSAHARLLTDNIGSKRGKKCL